MKTERMTLLIAPNDKAAIAARAEALGLSVSELVRQAAIGYDPADAEALAELAALVPELEAMVDRLEARFTQAAETSKAHALAIAELRSPEYRAQIRNDLVEDRSINWDSVASMFGFDQAPHERFAA